jgi:carbamoyltransferase
MDILGISFGVDTSACLLRDGQVVAAVLEERFSRIKHDRSWPAASIAWCLEQGGTTLDAIDEVAFFWNPALQLDYPHPGRSRTYRHHGDYLHMVPSWLLGGLSTPVSGPWTRQTIALDGRSPLKITYVTHHLCHAAAAFFPSPYDSAAVLTVDGHGERASASIGRFDGNSYTSHRELIFPQSLGAFYAAITGYLGFRPNSGEGKVMGLAPYGDERFVGSFRELLGLGKDPSRPFDIDLSWFEYHLEGPRRVSQRFLDAFGPAAAPGAEHSDGHKAVARAAQVVTEEAMLALTALAAEATGERNLVMAGGVAMNSVANGRIERDGPFDSVWIQSSAGDGGTSVGAALWVWHCISGGEGRHRWTHDRLGPSFSDEACRSALRRGGWTWTEPENLAEDTAQALAGGELVGWFQGGAELGARALGGRSILADPRRPENKDVLNSRVKFREPFRPFAPSVLEERAAEFFVLPEGCTVPFMQKVHPVRESAREQLGAVTHIDGSARLQTVSSEASPEYHALIRAFGEITGVPVLVNTSFNVRGEPIVLTPDDAIRCWATTGLDRLVLGPCVVTKPSHD